MTAALIVRYCIVCMSAGEGKAKKGQVLVVSGDEQKDTSKLDLLCEYWGLLKLPPFFR